MAANALILAAGLGTRLRPLTELRAKPALPVAGEPLIRRIVRWLTAGGVTDLVVNLHHRPETLTAVLGDGSDVGARVRYSWEQPRVLGSAGGPRKALPLLDTDPFFIVNGDTLAEIDLEALADAHRQSGALVTMVLVPNREFLRYGGVLIDDGGRITGFSRRGRESDGSWHFVGVQVASRAAFASLQDDEPVNSVGQLYDELIRARAGSLNAFCCDVPFWDIGTPADYLRMSVAVAADQLDVGARAKIDPSARLSQSVLWDDVEIGANVTLTRCIVTDGVSVPAGAEYSSAILMPHEDGGLTVTTFDI